MAAAAAPSAIARMEARAAGSFPPLHPKKQTAVLPFSPRPSAKSSSSGKFFGEEAKGGKKGPSDTEQGLDYFTQKYESIRHKVFEETMPAIAGARVLLDAKYYLSQDILPFAEEALKDRKVPETLQGKIAILLARVIAMQDDIEKASPVKSTNESIHISYFLAKERQEDSACTLETYFEELVAAEKAESGPLSSGLMELASRSLTLVREEISSLQKITVTERSHGLNQLDIEERPRFIEAAYRTIKVAVKIMHNIALLQKDSATSGCATAAGAGAKGACPTLSKDEVLALRKEVNDIFRVIRTEWIPLRPASETSDSDEENELLLSPLLDEGDA